MEYVEMIWSIVMAAIDGTGGRRSSCVVTYIHNIDWSPVLLLHGWMFVTMSIHVSTTVTKFLFWKLEVGIMEPFCSCKIEAQCSGLCCTLVQQKDTHVCLILEVVFCNLASFFSIRIQGLSVWARPLHLVSWFPASDYDKILQIATNQHCDHRDYWIERFPQHHGQLPYGPGFKNHRGLRTRHQIYLN